MASKKLPYLGSSTLLKILENFYEAKNRLFEAYLGQRSNSSGCSSSKARASLFFASTWIRSLLDHLERQSLSIIICWIQLNSSFFFYKNLIFFQLENFEHLFAPIPLSTKKSRRVPAITRTLILIGCLV